MLAIEGLTRTFVKDGREIRVLAGVDLEIEAGDSVSIMGRSGAGKTTLLQVVGTLDRPTSGAVRFDGDDVFSLKDRALSEFRGRSIGFMFQFHHLLPDFTTLENAAMPCIIAGLSRAEALSRAGELLERVGLGSRLTHVPGELSGGEQQRVALARALVMRPKLVLADEPTGNLDAATGAGIVELFRELTEELRSALVVVTHNVELAAKMRRHLEMVGGVLREADA
ncbi:MAG: ABC transporter ATP-binding protein [Myxococcales bacterium]|nr:ABC transporter ATP-binding protein [Myxococcales bacterium]MCB9520605.1 ABC transporter ATP-binding protein [Myxococcales bacterium]MCB9531528.1 ABC transporter ATP-binding protein [Myxococcales bacterium]